MAWYVAVTRPNQWERARDNLERQSVRVCVPLERWKVVRRNRIVDRCSPLFLNHIFIDPPMHIGFSTIESTLGISRMIRTTGDRVAEVPEAVMASQVLPYAETPAERPAKFVAGDAIRLRAMPELSGEFVRIDPKLRCVILVSLLGAPRRIALGLDEIEKVA
jgi:transcription antitermination factor NusG